MRAIILTVLGAFAGMHGGDPAASAPSSQTAGVGDDDFDRLGRRVIELVREQFYDRERAARWCEAHAAYASGASSLGEFARRTNVALAELRTSHTAFYTPADMEYRALASIFQTRDADREWTSLGLDVVRRGDEWFVRTVFAGGPAHAAGVLRGDRIVTADGRPFDPVRATEGAVAARNSAVVLAVQRRRGAAMIEIPVVPRRVAPRREWLDAQIAGSRVIERAGRRIAYVPMFACAGDEFRDALREFIQGHGEADALVIDFRDGWGGCNPDFMNLFNPLAPSMTTTRADGKASQYVAAWRKPLFVLINGGTRSGKEMVAFAIRKHHVGTLVGERTAGAVVAGTLFELPNRCVLYLAIADVRVDGERLEGRGVAPDVGVVDRLEFAKGEDRQLERALELATRSGG